MVGGLVLFGVGRGGDEVQAQGLGPVPGFEMFFFLCVWDGGGIDRLIGYLKEAAASICFWRGWERNALVQDVVGRGVVLEALRHLLPVGRQHQALGGWGGKGWWREVRRQHQVRWVGGGVGG